MKTYLLVFLLWIACILWWKILNPVYEISQSNLHVQSELEMLLADYGKGDDGFYDKELQKNLASGG